MAEIQRWHVTRDEWMWRSVSGVYVTYADHVAAVAKAEQRGRDEILNDGWAPAGYRKGQRDERDRIRKAVEGMTAENPVRGTLHRSAVLAVIDEVAP